MISVLLFLGVAVDSFKDFLSLRLFPRFFRNVANEVKPDLFRLKVDLVFHTVHDRGVRFVQASLMPWLSSEKMESDGQTKFKSQTKLFAFHFTLMPLGRL